MLSVCWFCCGGFAAVVGLVVICYIVSVRCFRFVCLAGGLWSLVWLLTCGVVCLLVVRLCVWLDCDGFGGSVSVVTLY